MEIKFYSPTEEQTITPVSWNYEEVKAWVMQGLEKYRGLVYTEDTITNAKKDRALLNKLAAAIDDARKEKKAQYLKPYEEFEAQAKELTALIKEQAAAVDAQVKAFDDVRKAKKQEEILALYEQKVGDLAEIVPYDKLHNSKWLNVTVSMKAIEDELDDKIRQIREGFVIIDRLNLDSDIIAQAKAAYVTHFDVSTALAVADQLKEQREKLKRYEEAKRAKEEEEAALRAAQTAPVEREAYEGINTTPAEEEALTIDFRVYATRSQLAKLKAFLIENGIKYGKVPGSVTE